MIEGRPQVVHDVANDGGYFSGGQHWDWLKEIGALRISVYSNTVSVTHEEGVNPALHVADVMIGPFDL